jgi:hypothetical protein
MGGQRLELLRGLERRAAILRREQIRPLEDYLWRMAETSAGCMTLAFAAFARVFLDERKKGNAD